MEKTVAEKYIPRSIEKTLKKAVKQFPSVIVTGPRQSGKTTLLKHVFGKKYTYVSMEKPDLRLMAEDDPDLFLQNYPPPVIIDEIQYTPGLFPYIKSIIDSNRSKPGQFLLTGSQIFPLMAGVSESLAGRIGVFTLLSFSCKEQFGDTFSLNINKLKKRILLGGFPEIITSRNIDINLWFAGYMQTYLERDVRQVRNIGNLGDFQRFLELAAAINGQILNLSNLSQDLGVAVNTVKAWISILEATGQIALVRPYFRNKGKRIIKSPKVYFLDTGLLCYLNGIGSVSQIFKGPFSGQFLEASLLGEIMRSFHNKGMIPRVYWWRTSHGDEVDFIIERKGKLIPIEVKLSAKTDQRQIKGLRSFCDLFKDRISKAYFVNLTEKELKIGDKIFSIPFAGFITGVLQ